MTTQITSASDNPVELQITFDGIKGEPGTNGTDGTNGAGFSEVRGSALDNPFTQILKRSEPVSLLYGPITYTRNSAATYKNIYGNIITATNDILRVEIEGYRLDGESTNLFLNSDAPVTQDITLASNDYVLSISGSGSVDTVFGNATEGNPVFFNTDGLASFAVSGSVDFVQVEQGKKATSFIVTDSQTATRAFDSLTFDAYYNLPQLTSPWSLSFYINQEGNDYCVIDSDELRIENNQDGFWVVNGIISTATAGKSVVISYDGTDTKIYIDGVLSSTIQVTYTGVTENTVRVGARVDNSKPMSGNILDLQFYTIALNEFEAQLLKGDL